LRAIPVPWGQHIFAASFRVIVVGVEQAFGESFLMQFKAKLTPALFRVTA
jgi:hypothetical protein